jgi:hypothetical protein
MRNIKPSDEVQVYSYLLGSAHRKYRTTASEAERFFRDFLGNPIPDSAAQQISVRARYADRNIFLILDGLLLPGTLPSGSAMICHEEKVASVKSSNHGPIHYPDQGSEYLIGFEDGYSPYLSNDSTTVFKPYCRMLMAVPWGTSLPFVRYSDRSLAYSYVQFTHTGNVGEFITLNKY